MPRFWPPTEECRAQPQRWLAWRRWAIPVAWVLGVVILAALAYPFLDGKSAPEYEEPDMTGHVS